MTVLDNAGHTFQEKNQIKLMSTISLLSKRTTKSSLSYFSSDFDVAETDNLADQSLFYKNGQHLTS